MRSVAWKADIEQVIVSGMLFIMMGGEAVGVLETFTGASFLRNAIAIKIFLK